MTSAGQVCAVDDCDRPSTARGWCLMHYKRWRNHGDPTVARPGVRPTPAKNLCAVDECPATARTRGWCVTHYTRWRRHGHPLTVHRLYGVQPGERFWPRVVGLDPLDCWEWTGGKQAAGYGNFSVNGHAISTHRFAYEHLIGDIPAGLELDHLCFNRACVNPWHLDPVTPEVNKRRMLDANRKTRCPWGHPYDATNTVFERDGSRKCRTCHETRDRTRTERRRIARSAR